MQRQRSSLYLKTGCTRLCFLLGGIGASLTITATFLAYAFLQEQLEFSSSLLLKGRFSSACSALQSLSNELTNSSAERLAVKEQLPEWMLGRGRYKENQITWTLEASAEVQPDANLIAKRNVLYSSDSTKSTRLLDSQVNSNYQFTHQIPKSECTQAGLQPLGQVNQLPIKLYEIENSGQNLFLVSLPENNREAIFDSSEQNSTGQIAIIDLAELIQYFAKREYEKTMSDWLPSDEDWLKIDTQLRTHMMVGAVSKEAEHIHKYVSPFVSKEKVRSAEVGLYQDTLLTSQGMEVIYEAWVDVNLLNQLPKRISGLIFIVGLLSSGVGVVMSRSALQREARISEAMRQQSRTDSLTNLPNRRAWDELLDRENNVLQRHGNRYAIAVIDLDHFKVVNDSLGHQAGDALLVRTAQVLRSIIRGEDIAARVGGDEFTVLFRELKDDCVEQQLLSRLEAAFVKERIDISIGVSFTQRDQTTLIATWHHADELMYVHKAMKK